MKTYKAQYYYPIDGRWITIKSSKSLEKAREALHRFWTNEKRFVTRISETEN